MDAKEHYGLPHWRCSKCGAVWNDKQVAERCCSPCKYCGRHFKTGIGGYTACETCREEKRQEHDEKQRQRVKNKIDWEEYYGPVFSDDFDRWFDDVECWVEWCYAEARDNDDYRTRFAWGSEPVKIRFDAEDLIYSCDPPDIDLEEATEALQDSLDSWSRDWCDGDNVLWWVTDEDTLVTYTPKNGG